MPLGTAAGPQEQLPDGEFFPREVVRASRCRHQRKEGASFATASAQHACGAGFPPSGSMESAWTSPGARDRFEAEVDALEDRLRLPKAGRRLFNDGPAIASVDPRMSVQFTYVSPVKEGAPR